MYVNDISMSVFRCSQPSKVITGGVKTNIVRPNLPPPGSMYESMRKDYEGLRSAMKTGT